MMKLISIGEFNRRVHVQTFKTGKDADGAEARTWSTLSIVWAKFTGMQGREQFLAKQEVSLNTTKITIRYFRGLTTKHRFVYNDRVFSIGTINNIEERDVYQECTCIEGDAV